MDRQIIALTGPQGSGKTTLARLMTGQGYTRMRLAEPLKRMLTTFLYDQGVGLQEIYEMLDGTLKETPSKYFHDQTPRHAMQTLGSEWRDLIHKELWVDAWERTVLKSSFKKIVLDDVRFLHEASRVKKLGGKIFRIQRPGTTSGLHVSEREYERIDVDGIILNDRDVPHMLTQMNAFLGVLQ